MKTSRTAFAATVRPCSSSAEDQRTEARLSAENHLRPLHEAQPQIQGGGQAAAAPPPSSRPAEAGGPDPRHSPTAEDAASNPSQRLCLCPSRLPSTGRRPPGLPGMTPHPGTLPGTESRQRTTVDMVMINAPWVSAMPAARWEMWKGKGGSLQAPSSTTLQPTSRHPGMRSPHSGLNFLVSGTHKRR